MSGEQHIAVLVGGPAAEAEVSRNSGAQVAQALASRNFKVSTLELDEQVAAELIRLNPDVVFPVLHGPPGEDGTVQGLLEMLHLPYVGSGVRGCALAMDKAVAKAVFQRAGLPVLDDLILHPDGAPLARQVEEVNTRFGEQVVIKPLNQGSAIGVTPLPEGGDLAAALSSGLKFGPCLVEPYFAGRETTVGVLQTGARCQTFPVIEIQTADGEWYDYENRYTVGQSRHVIPAGVSEDCQQKLRDYALRAHLALGLRDLSRADFIVGDDEQIILLEVNTLPGMTPTSLYPDGARELGYEFPELMHMLVDEALQRDRNP